MRRSPTRVTLALAALLAGCQEAAAPVRAPAYEFDLGGTGLVFRWTADRTPVRYWVSPDAGVVRGFVETALAAWARQFLYGEFRGVIVADSSDADVRIRVQPATPPAGTPTDDPPVPGACAGVTSFQLSEVQELVGPFTVVVSWRPSYPDADVINCLERVTVHEVGHTIGLFGHSGSELDLMNTVPWIRAPSSGDRVTAEVLYHTAPTIRPPPP